MQVFKHRASSLRALLEASAGFGDKEYIVFEDRRITYRKHFAAVASVAKALQDNYGVTHGDRVAILAANDPAWIITYWAAVSLGAIAVGLNGWWVADEIRYALSDCAPTVLVVMRSVWQGSRDTCFRAVVTMDRDLIACAPTP